MATRIRVDGGALKAKRESLGLTQSSLARLAARHKDAAPAAERLASWPSLQTAASNLERGTADLMGADTLDAIAAALCCDVRDLTEPVRWGLRDDEGCLVAPGGVAVLNTTEPGSWRTYGTLSGANGQLAGQIFRSKPVALFATERDEWISENFDDLDEREREHVIAVDATYSNLRVLWHLDVAATSPSARERRYGVEYVIRATREVDAPELAELGTPEVIALDVIELAHELAERRLTCDRLRDAPASTFDRWKTEAQHLSEAVDLARSLIESH